jgi:gas vesicle protein
MVEKISSKVSYLLVGVGIGSLVGILFAPKSGEDTREYLAQKAR